MTSLELHAIGIGLSKSAVAAHTNFIMPRQRALRSHSFGEPLSAPVLPLCYEHELDTRPNGRHKSAISCFTDPI